jgi:hypothetical protein
MTAMRRIVTFNWLTADGYFAGSDGNLSWVVPDDEQAKAAAESIAGFDERGARPPGGRAIPVGRRHAPLRAPTLGKLTAWPRGRPRPTPIWAPDH